MIKNLLLFTVVLLLGISCSDRKPAPLPFVQKMQRIKKINDRYFNKLNLPVTSSLDVRYPTSLPRIAITNTEIKLDSTPWIGKQSKFYSRTFGMGHNVQIRTSSSCKFEDFDGDCIEFETVNKNDALGPPVPSPYYLLKIKNGRVPVADLRDGKFGLLITPLYETLKNTFFKGDFHPLGILLYIDENVEWELIRKVLYTLEQAQFAEFGAICNSNTGSVVIPMTRQPVYGVGGEWNAYWQVLKRRTVTSHKELTVWPFIILAQEGVYGEVYYGGPPSPSSVFEPAVFYKKSVSNGLKGNKQLFVVPSNTFSYEQISHEVFIYRSKDLCQTNDCITSTAHQGKITTLEGGELLIPKNAQYANDQLTSLLTQLSDLRSQPALLQLQIDEDVKWKDIAPSFVTILKHTPNKRISTI